MLATITILITDRHKNIGLVNKVLTQYGYIVLARLGVSLDQRCLKGCRGLITVVVEGTKAEIGQLTKKLNGLSQTTAKNTFITK